MSLTTYPDLIIAAYARTPLENVLIDTYEGWAEQRRKKSDVKRLRIELTHQNLIPAEVAVIEAFYDARGMFQAFRFLELNEVDYTITGEVVDASYNGTDPTSQLDKKFIVPGSETIYDDATPLTAGVNYNLDVVADTGTITWLINPAASSVITADYQFHRRVRFAAPVTREQPEHKSFIYRIQLIEVFENA